MRKSKLKGQLKTHYLKEEILVSSQVNPPKFSKGKLWRVKKRKRKKSKVSRIRPKIEEAVKSISFFSLPSSLKIIGVGGGGCSIISEIAGEMKGEGFIAANTDAQALNQIVAPNVTRFQFGQNLTFGLGAGMNPDLGREAAENEKEKIKGIFKDTEFCILISCLGGGTGSGASPVFAEAAREVKCLSFGIFTLPFQFEGEKRAQISSEALEKLKSKLNGFAVISNENIFQVIDKDTPLKEAFFRVNKILSDSLKGLIESIYSTGLINIDFSDLKHILRGKGELSYLNTLELERSDHLEESVKRVLQNPLYSYSVEGAKGVLFHISGGQNLSLTDVEKISQTISSAVGPRARVAFGVTQNEDYQDKVKITLLATGCGKEEKPEE